MSNLNSKRPVFAISLEAVTTGGAG